VAVICTVQFKTARGSGLGELTAVLLVLEKKNVKIAGSATKEETAFSKAQAVEKRILISQ
jgi:hypothetical protein